MARCTLHISIFLDNEVLMDRSHLENVNHEGKTFLNDLKESESIKN